MVNISFPGIGIDSFELDPVAFTIPLFGGLEVRWYGLIITLGIILAFTYCAFRSKQEGIKFDDLLDFAIFTVIFGVIGARTFYVLTSIKDGKYTSFYDIIAIWEGGLAIYGGVIGAAAAVVVFCKIKKMPCGPLLDVGGLGLLIGQMIGRWGNFMNREAHGAVTDSFLKMGLADAAGNVTYYHPTFLYESLWNLVGFIALHFYTKRRKFDGEVFALYVAWYGLGRAWIEGMRTDSLYLFGTGIRVSQLLAVVSFAGAAALIAYVWIKRNPQPEQLYVNRQTVSEEIN